MTCTIQGVRELLVRNGWPCRMPDAGCRMPDAGCRALGGTRRRWGRWGRWPAGPEVWSCAEGSRRPVEPGSSSRTKPASP
ncbi:hypothetical protein POF50_008385 [Streptomyces sp. SL13]|uniref:Uncharacterized protein n=1 Tax=Streptantibioticus silvisoli TaxID=2705255 RepID=A0AA90GWG2_9ACTN|nr:hypothetical protein [Streptantibioticus silvisoli]MDI5969363.1 hypothetical protein [Streptantibioticus silvisoli]